MDEWVLAARARLYPIANYVFNSARGVALIVQTFVIVLTLSLAIAILLIV